MGETFTIADAYLYVMLTWCEKQGIDIALWPNLHDYEDRISRRPSVIEALAQEGLPIPHHYEQLHPHVLSQARL
jgi:glutathione S-transferase